MTIPFSGLCFSLGPEAMPLTTSPRLPCVGDFIFFQENEQMTERHHETPSKKGLLPFTYKGHVLFLQSSVASVVTWDQNPPHSEVLPLLL